MTFTMFTVAIIAALLTTAYICSHKPSWCTSAYSCYYHSTLMTLSLTLFPSQHFDAPQPTLLAIITQSQDFCYYTHSQPCDSHLITVAIKATLVVLSLSLLACYNQSTLVVLSLHLWQSQHIDGLQPNPVDIMAALLALSLHMYPSQHSGGPQPIPVIIKSHFNGPQPTPATIT